MRRFCGYVTGWPWQKAMVQKFWWPPAKGPSLHFKKCQYVGLSMWLEVRKKGCESLKCAQMRDPTVSFALDKTGGIGEWGALGHWGLRTHLGTGINPKPLSSSLGGSAAPPASGYFMLAALVMFMHNFVVQAKAIKIASNTYSNLKAHFWLVEAENRDGEKGNSHFF